MSYEIVKGLTFNFKEEKVVIRSACNNVVPRITETWEIELKEYADTYSNYRGLAYSVYQNILGGEFQFQESAKSVSHISSLLVFYMLRKAGLQFGVQELMGFNSMINTEDRIDNILKAKTIEEYLESMGEISNYYKRKGQELVERSNKNLDLIKTAHELTNKIGFNYFYNLVKNKLPKSITQKKYLLRYEGDYVEMSCGRRFYYRKKEYSLKDLIIILSKHNLWQDVEIINSDTGKEITLAEIIKLGDIGNVLAEINI